MAREWEWLDQPAAIVAPRLLGCWLRRRLDGRVATVRIVETEAYDQADAASHSYRGQTPRSAAMFGPSGRLYVYFTYGLHHCLNIVTGPAGNGAAVLIRAVEPLEGQAVLAAHRPGYRGSGLTNGPAKLCQALAIDRTLDGHDLGQPPLELISRPPVKAADIVRTTRIGISQATEAPLRFYIRANPYVSRQ